MNSLIFLKNNLDAIVKQKHRKYKNLNASEYQVLRSTLNGHTGAP